MLSASTAKNRSVYFDLTIPFYGFNRDHVPTNDGLRKASAELAAGAALKGNMTASMSSLKSITRDLQQIDRPTLIIHGDDDQMTH
jgi:non-heme chloroperoxidase